MKGRLLAGAVASVLLFSFAGGAGAAEEIIIDVEGVARGAPGEIRFILEQPVDPALVGATCTGFSETANNSSVHPNTELILTSGGRSVTIPNVEEFPGEQVDIAGEVVLGESIRVDLRISDDGVSSGGFIVTLNCEPLPPPTTTVAPTTTTAPPATTTTAPPATTTTVPPATTTTTIPDEVLGQEIVPSPPAQAVVAQPDYTG